MHIKHHKGFFLVAVIIVITLNVQAQTEAKPEADIFTDLRLPDTLGATITLMQDATAPLIFDRMERINQKTGLMGFRIQLYNGSGQDSREVVQKMVNDFLTKFPEFDPATIYQEYQAPYFKLRVGDFRTKNEAFEFYHKLKQYYPNSYIVKSRINFPKLYVESSPEPQTN